MGARRHMAGTEECFVFPLRGRSYSMWTPKVDGVRLLRKDGRPRKFRTRRAAELSARAECGRLDALEKE